MQTGIRQASHFLVLLLLCSGCSGAGGGQGTTVPSTTGLAEQSSRLPQASVTYTGSTINVVAPENDAIAVRIQSVPGARCTTDFDTQPFYADPSGLLVLWASVSADAPAAATVNLHCSGDATTHALAIQHGAPHTPAMPKPLAPVTSADIAAASARYGFDVLTASDAVLMAHDLPLRPQSKLDGWLRAVTSFTTKVVHLGVKEPEYPIGPTKKSPSATSYSTNYIWSGAVHTSFYDRFAIATSEWNTPTMYPSLANNANAYLATWVGVDGYGTSDVIQNGTMSQINLYMVGHGYIKLASYYMWYEYYPNLLASVGSIAANDDVFCQASAVSPYSSTTQAYHYCKDNTSGLVESVLENAPGSYYLGASAEFIVERPTINGTQVLGLPPFGTASMINSQFAYGGSGTWYGVSDESNSADLILSIFGAGAYNLDTASVDSSCWCVDFTWNAEY